MPVAAALEEILLVSAANDTSSIGECSKKLKLYSKDITEKLKIQLKIIPDLIKMFHERNHHTNIKKIINNLELALNEQHKY